LYENLKGDHFYDLDVDERIILKRFLWENPKGDNFEDLDLDERIILKRTGYICIQDRNHWRTLKNKAMSLVFELLTDINMKLERDTM
jgi:hypothetical protein